MVEIPIAVVGVGKIARDQHLPAIAAGGDFRLAAVVVRRAEDAPPGVPAFPTVSALADAGLARAVALCVPPQVRFELAGQAIGAGLHVLLEKPPAATLGQLEALTRAADARGVTLFAAWHARFARGVEAAREWLSGRRIDAVRIDWREDVRRWHPGQDWLFEPGGMGVFDPGINALSIAAHVLPPFHLQAARLMVPGNRRAPIAAELRGAVGTAAFAADFDFLHAGEPVWEIAVDTDGGPLRLHRTGEALEIAGEERPLPGTREYPSLYAHFAQLIANGASDVDARPLAHVADAFLVGERVEVDAFHW